MTHWLKKTVHVRADMDPAARAKTLAHDPLTALTGDRSAVSSAVH